MSVQALVYWKHLPLRDEASRQQYELAQGHSSWMKKAISSLEDLISSYSDDPIEAVILFHSQLNAFKDHLLLSLAEGIYKPTHSRWFDLLRMLNAHSRPYRKTDSSYHRFQTPQTVALSIAIQINSDWQMEEEAELYQAVLDHIVGDWHQLALVQNDTYLYSAASWLPFIAQLKTALSS